MLPPTMADPSDASCVYPVLGVPVGEVWISDMLSAVSCDCIPPWESWKEKVGVCRSGYAQI